MRNRLWRILAAIVLAAPGTVAAGPGDAPGGQPSLDGLAQLKYEYPKFLTGRIFGRDSGTNQLLFKFKRTASRSGSILNVTREFAYPDGRPAALERIVYDGDALVSTDLEEQQIGARGSAKISRRSPSLLQGVIEFEYCRAAGVAPKLGREALAANVLIGDMVGPFLSGQWERLARGESVKCRYLVIPRRETVGFTFVKDSESGVAGRGIMVVKMEVSSPFLSALVSPLFFTIEKAPPHRVVQYDGRTTPKIQVGHAWKDLDAVTVFDWDTAR